jgi:hypothetical protein
VERPTTSRSAWSALAIRMSSFAVSPLRMDERDVDTVVVPVPSDLLAEFLRLIGHRLLKSAVRNDWAGKRG